MTWSEIIVQSYSGYWNYLTHELLHPHAQNYFYWLLGLSLATWSIELIVPWRKQQKRIRQDFWLDAFYMLFNFFLFSLIGFSALSNIGVDFFQHLLQGAGIQNTVLLHLESWPTWSRMIILFLVSDFLQWNIHRLLHRVPWLWEFHKIHHSVVEMGFAAHLRYHWMENIVYKSLLFVPLSLLGFGLLDMFVMHIFAIAIGHLNHSNIDISWGPLRYIFNSPAMHIWHHAKEIPTGKYGVNYGISLSLWDYLFGTAHLPHNGRDIALGFDGIAHFPSSFLGQAVYPFKRKKKGNIG